eukprot:COSAG02_NODE_124_length_35047_cov_31.554179_18_plen_168_part_00
MKWSEGLRDDTTRLTRPCWHCSTLCDAAFGRTRMCILTVYIHYSGSKSGAAKKELFCPVGNAFPAFPIELVIAAFPTACTPLHIWSFGEIVFSKKTFPAAASWEERMHFSFQPSQRLAGIPGFKPMNTKWEACFLPGPIGSRRLSRECTWIGIQPITPSGHAMMVIL